MQSNTTSAPTFKPVAGFPGYRVGDDGTVWSCRLNGTGGMTDKWHRLKPTKAKNGYLRITISADGKRRRMPLHRLVLLVFVGPCPGGMEGCHNDGDKENNCLVNLRYDTPKNNHADKIRHGTIQVGEKHGCAKLGEIEVVLIREQYGLGGVTQRQLAARFGVTQSAIYLIVNTKKWKHI